MRLTSTGMDTLPCQSQSSQEGNSGRYGDVWWSNVPLGVSELFIVLLCHFYFIHVYAQCLRFPRDHRAGDQHRLLGGSDPVAGSGESSPWRPSRVFHPRLWPHPHRTKSRNIGPVSRHFSLRYWLLIRLFPVPLAAARPGMLSLAAVWATNSFHACCFSNSPSHFPQETNGARHLRRVHASKKVSTETHSVCSWHVSYCALLIRTCAAQQALPLSSFVYIVSVFYWYNFKFQYYERGLGPRIFHLEFQVEISWKYVVMHGGSFPTVRFRRQVVKCWMSHWLTYNNIFS